MEREAACGEPSVTSECAASERPKEAPRERSPEEQARRHHCAEEEVGRGEVRLQAQFTQKTSTNIFDGRTSFRTIVTVRRMLGWFEQLLLLPLPLLTAPCAQLSRSFTQWHTRRLVQSSFTPTLPPHSTQDTLLSLITLPRPLALTHPTGHAYSHFHSHSVVLPRDTLATENACCTGNLKYKKKNIVSYFAKVWLKVIQSMERVVHEHEAKRVRLAQRA